MISERILAEVQKNPATLAAFCYGEGYTVSTFFRRLVLENEFSDEQFKEIFDAWVDYVVAEGVRRIL